MTTQVFVVTVIRKMFFPANVWVSFAKIGEARSAGRLAPVDGIESGKDMGPCTF